MNYLGDFTTSNTVYVYFNTFDSNDPSASVTLTGLAVTDIEIYKNGSVTQRSSDAGYTLLDTDGIDFDAITGIHGFSIDLSDNTDAGFFATGGEYTVVVSSVTVDAATINFIAGSFSIERTGGALALLKGATGLAAIDTVVDGIQTDLSNGTDGLGALKTLIDTVNTDLSNATDGLGAIKTSVDAIPTTAMRGTDNAATAASLATAQADLDIITGATGVNLLAATQVSIDAILLDTGTTLDTKINDIQGATFSSVTDSLEAIRDRGDAAWTTGAGGTPPTTLQNTTIATLASQTSFTLTAGSADNDAYNDAIIVITDAATATQKAVGIVADYVGSTKTITLAADPAVFTMAVTDVVDIIANAKIINTVTTNTDMRGTDSAALASVCTEGRLAELDAANIPADVDNILTDTADMQPRVVAIEVDTSTTLDGKIDTIDTVVDGIQTDLSNATDGLGAIKTDTAAILVDTGTTLDGKIDTIDTVVDGIQTDLSNATDGLGAIKTDTAAILVDTGTTIPGTVTTLQADTDDIQTRLPAALIGGKMDSDVEAINNSAPAAVNLKLSTLQIISGACEGTPSTTVIQTDLAETSDDIYIGRIIIFTNGAAQDEATDITDYVGATGTITVTALSNAPAAGNTFIII